jgi:hypothetical protein
VRGITFNSLHLTSDAGPRRKLFGRKGDTLSEARQVWRQSTCLRGSSSRNRQRAAVHLHEGKYTAGPAAR